MKEVFLLSSRGRPSHVIASQRRSNLDFIFIARDKLRNLGSNKINTFEIAAPAQSWVGKLPRDGNRGLVQQTASARSGVAAGRVREQVSSGDGFRR
jgi:hypothetical protein